MINAQPSIVIAPHQKEQDCFYICKTSNADFSSLGLISPVSTTLIKNNIFFHEQISPKKIKHHISCLDKNRIQINPVILVHENDIEIENYLNLAIKNKLPTLAIEGDETLYEFWKISENKKTQEIYRNINHFLIADGHHRIESFKNLPQIKFFLALMVSRKNIFSKEVYRKYHNLDAQKKEICLNFLRNNFELSQIQEIPKKLQELVFVDCGKKILIKKSASKNAQHKILDFFNKNIGRDDDGNLNFTHCAIGDYETNSKADADPKTNLEILIPKFRLEKNLIKTKIYPPHSSWFEPKIPNGLISLAL